MQNLKKIHAWAQMKVPLFEKNHRQQKSYPVSKELRNIFFFRNGTIDVHEFAALWKYIQDWKSCFDR